MALYNFFAKTETLIINMERIFSIILHQTSRFTFQALPRRLRAFHCNRG